MRFIHFSDLRLGHNAESGRRWEQDRNDEIFSTLKNIIKKAEELSCELLIISGDLFSHQPVTSELESMNRLFLSIPGTEIVMVTGRGDMIRKNSPILSFNWAPNVHFEPKDGPVKYRLPRLGAVVYGISVFEHSGKGTKELSEFIAEDRDEELLIRIAAIWEPSSEKAEEAFSGLDISYAALGGKESHEELLSGKLCYSGGPEPASMSDGGPHGIYVGDISGASGRVVKLEFLPMASVTYMPLAIKINKNTDMEELNELIASEIEKRGNKNIYRLRLFGNRDPKLDLDFSGITGRYRISEVIDETEPQYDFEAIYDEHPYDLLGYYINRIRRNRTELTELDRKAMYYGIDALLRTSEDDGGQQ
ncbi:MAG TPA: hypothetical protein IAB09_02170 [Candidatus Avilachnospira avicola]|nr:hypothetical protein [Candidatus Avilachnospira avicola]